MAERARRARRAAAARPRGAPGQRRQRRDPGDRPVARTRGAHRRLSGHLASRRRVRHARPLPRPPHDRADVRAPRRGRSWGGWSAPCPEEEAKPDDYEAALAPLYAWMHAMAERSGSGKRRPPSSASTEAWRVLGGDGHRPLRGRLLAGILPLGISGVNRLGLGPVRADFSAEELRRAGVLAMSEAVAPARHRGSPRPLRPHAPRRPIGQRRLARMGTAGRGAG